MNLCRIEDAGTQPCPTVEPHFRKTGKLRPAGSVRLSVCQRQTFRLGLGEAGAHGIKTLGGAAGTTFAPLQPHRLLAHETEPMQPGPRMV